MYSEYIGQLEQKIAETKVYDSDGETLNGFEEGMKQLEAMFKAAKESGKRLFFIGNGGSAAIAIHMTADFLKNGGMKTVSMYDGAALTCLGNDYGFEYVFEKQIHRLGENNDLLVAISSSGNSPNIVRACSVAQETGMTVITFSGFDADNAIRKMGHLNLHVPIRHYGIVESIHNLILQEIVDMLHDQADRDE